MEDVIKDAHKLASAYRITDGKKFRLKDHDPGDTAWLGKRDKNRAGEALEAGVEAMAELQNILYAQRHWGVLLVFQAMDAAGKDSAIRHVMSGINPQGCHVTSFKAPSSEELDHDYLWRCSKVLPRRGHIGIFNRSYYEEVLVLKVHPELLARQRLPDQRQGKGLWKDRYRDIRAFENYLDTNGIIVCKFFLNLSREEQLKRFLSRIDTPEKNWKFETGDVTERGHWDEYMDAYETAIRHTATASCPWHVVPADNKWFSRLVVASVVVETLASLGLEYPRVDEAKLAELAACRKMLIEDK